MLSEDEILIHRNIALKWFGDPFNRRILKNMLYCPEASDGELLIILEGAITMSRRLSLDC